MQEREKYYTREVNNTLVLVIIRVWIDQWHRFSGGIRQMLDFCGNSSIAPVYAPAPDCQVGRICHPTLGEAVSKTALRLNRP